MKPTPNTPTHQRLSNGTKSVTKDTMTFQWYQERDKRCYGFPMVPRVGQETLQLGRSQSNKQTSFHR
jgi:hypothetical protein